MKRGVSRAELLASLARFDRLIDSLHYHPLLFCSKTIVASLLSSRLGWVADHIETALRQLAGGRYLIFRDVLCCSSFGARFTRPRVYWLMYLH